MKIKKAKKERDANGKYLIYLILPFSATDNLAWLRPQ